MTVTAALMAAKKAKGMSFADLESAMGLDEVWIASLFYGQATASKEEAEKLAELLSLDSAITAALQEFPTKGSLDPVIPTCLLYTSPSPRDRTRSRMPSSA